MRTIFTKRWFLFFLLLFAVWYPVSVILFTGYQLTLSPFFFIATNAFTPLWFVFVAYRFFKKSRNDWTSRLVTAVGWIALMFFFAALLVKPVYGYDWTSIINIDVIMANWINVVAVVVAGVAAQKIRPTIEIKD
ncbi:hypothetical protein HOI18_03625 [Candidatus Uhrbacteria bacterium]|nr:hypothetical protein [Candidatus Uhrbacteria bacterium]